MVILSLEINLEFVDEIHMYILVLFSGASYIVSKKEKKKKKEDVRKQ